MHAGAVAEPPWYALLEHRTCVECHTKAVQCTAVKVGKGAVSAHLHLPSTLLVTVSRKLGCTVHRAVRSWTGEDTLVRAGEGKLPGHTLALSMARVWEAIREQRDLNLPAHKVTPLRRDASSLCSWPTQQKAVRRPRSHMPGAGESMVLQAIQLHCQQNIKAREHLCGWGR